MKKCHKNQTTFRGQHLSAFSNPTFMTVVLNGRGIHFYQLWCDRVNCLHKDLGISFLLPFLSDLNMTSTTVCWLCGCDNNSILSVLTCFRHCPTDSNSFLKPFGFVFCAGVGTLACSHLQMCLWSVSFKSLVISSLSVPGTVINLCFHFGGSQKWKKCSKLHLSLLKTCNKMHGIL